MSGRRVTKSITFEEPLKRAKRAKRRFLGRVSILFIANIIGSGIVSYLFSSIALGGIFIGITSILMGCFVRTWLKDDPMKYIQLTEEDVKHEIFKNQFLIDCSKI